MQKYTITIYDDREDAILPVSVFRQVKAVGPADIRAFGETLAKCLNIYRPRVEIEKEKK